MEENQTPVWLDCDPGHDDAMAIILAGCSPMLKLLGVSTVFGNSKIERTTINACRVVYSVGLTGVDVIKGSEGPINDTHKHLKDLEVSEQIHGRSGLETRSSKKLPETVPLEPKKISNPFVHISEVILKSAKKVHVVATGCLTNIAILLKAFPETEQNIEQIVFMGGAINFGNVTPAAEANILLDPEAAEIVCNSGLKVVMVPLEVTHTALVTPDVRERILALKTDFAEMVDGLMQYFTDTYQKTFNFEYPPLHDPCAICYVIAPELFKAEFVFVEIERATESSRGRTICDMYKLSKEEKNVHMTTKMDVSKFWDLMIAALEIANSQCRV
jgi:inosine-uridine nucleoside N-ribohydrolase